MRGSWRLIFFDLFGKQPHLGCLAEKPVRDQPTLLSALPRKYCKVTLRLVVPF